MPQAIFRFGHPLSDFHRVYSIRPIGSIPENQKRKTQNGNKTWPVPNIPVSKFRQPAWGYQGVSPKKHSGPRGTYLGPGIILPFGKPFPIYWGLFLGRLRPIFSNTEGTHTLHNSFGNLAQVGLPQKIFHGANILIISPFSTPH